jgi:hypothetical protein
MDVGVVSVLIAHDVYNQQVFSKASYPHTELGA